MPICARVRKPTRSLPSSPSGEGSRAAAKHLVFDSKLTTYANLVRLDQELHIDFITLRRRFPKLLREVYALPAPLGGSGTGRAHRQYRTPRVHEQKVKLEDHWFRQIFVLDLGTSSPPSC